MIAQYNPELKAEVKVQITRGIEVDLIFYARTSVVNCRFYQELQEELINE